MSDSPKFFLCPDCGPVHVIPVEHKNDDDLRWWARHCGGPEHFFDDEVTDRPTPKQMRNPMVTDMVAWLVRDNDSTEAGTLHMGTVTGVQGSTVEVLEEDADTVQCFHKRYVELVPVPTGSVWG